VRHARSVTSFQFFGGVQAPVLQVFLFVGVLFIIVNLALSRLSRRLEVVESKRTSVGEVKRVSGLEEQVV
jgi:hypothetical protein